VSASLRPWTQPAIESTWSHNEPMDDAARWLDRLATAQCTATAAPAAPRLERARRRPSSDERFELPDDFAAFVVAAFSRRPDTKGALPKEGSYQHFSTLNPVEVAGIEPASFNLSPSLLRAQPVTFLDRRLATGAGRRPQPAKFSFQPAGVAKK
jgi:hypothetical protein